MIGDRSRLSVAAARGGRQILKRSVKAPASGFIAAERGGADQAVRRRDFETAGDRREDDAPAADCARSAALRPAMDRGAVRGGDDRVGRSEDFDRRPDISANEPLETGGRARVRGAGPKGERDKGGRGRRPRRRERDHAAVR